ncbi:MAG TPA: aminotransferase class V-fold PLP-dependent enzyme [Caldithrix abyssi]|uniref:Aminotransferase class V-fold PLP-dependent enzyme n=1 Tax=Caldithrix abyssi TaxID=187145 RepID=A0A7V4WWD9_CALAY|nr:aminotransferase class V-fold PLP-dependent enzyme [Caldithrix abyssi]
MPFSKYRTLFPVTTQKIYLNHAAISPLSTRVTDRLEWYLDERGFGDIDVFAKAKEIREEARRTISELIHGAADNIAFIGNTSEGFNHLVNGLPWKKGDRVVLTDYEFPSNIYPFKNLERFGVEIVYVANRDGQIFLEDVEQALTPRTRLLSISFVEFSNGFRNDLPELGRLCRERNIIFSVDGIQGTGALPMRVEEWGVDFLSNGGHKWLMGTMGAGFMYIAPHLLEQLTPAFTGWLAVEQPWDFFNYRQSLVPDARRFEYATANFMGITALAASAGLLLEAGPEKIEQHLLSLGDYLIDQLSELGLEFKGSTERNHRSGIYSFGGKNTEELFHHLTGQRIICSLRNGLLRISPHFYNTKAEIEELINEVKRFYQQ